MLFSVKMAAVCMPLTIHYEDPCLVKRSLNSHPSRKSVVSCSTRGIRPRLTLTGKCAQVRALSYAGRLSKQSLRAGSSNVLRTICAAQLLTIVPSALVYTERTSVAAQTLPLTPIAASTLECYTQRI